MIRLLFCLFLVYLAPLSSLASEVVDNAWGEQHYKKLFLPNLIINGKFDLTFEEPIPDHRWANRVQFRKCWSISEEDFKKVDSVVKSGVVRIPQSGFFELHATPLNYKDSLMLMRKMEVSVRGQFIEPSAIAKIGFCKDSCTEISVPLKLNNEKLTADLGDLLVGGQISTFSILIKRGIRSITSVSLGTVGADVDLSRRDMAASEYCFKPPLSLASGDWWTLPLLLVLSLVSLMLLVWVVVRREWFLSIFVSVYLSFSFFGLWVLYFGLSEYRLAQGIVDRTKLLVLGGVNVFVLIGIVVMWNVFSLCGNRTPSGNGNIRVKVAFVFYATLALVLVSLALSNFVSYLELYFSCVGPHCAVKLSQLRQDITDLGFLKPHYQKLLFYYVTTFLSYVIISWMLDAAVRGRITKITSLILFQMFILTYNGEKAPVLWYFFGLGYLVICSRFAVKRLVPFSVLFSFAVGPAVLAAFGVSIADRLSLGSLTVGYKVLDIFPHKIAYLNGKTIFDPFGLWGGGAFDLPFYLWRFIHPELVFSTLQGTSVTAFWGEAYANFGVVGLILSGLIFGALLAVLFILSGRIFSPKTIGAVYAWIIFRYSVFTESLFSTLILDFYLIGFSIILLLVLVLQYVLRMVISNGPR